MKRWLVAFLLITTAPLAQEADYDLLIRGGRVIDGTGNPWYPADIAIRGDRVVAMGRLEGARAAVVLDASGLYVTPGFIDSHTHAGEGLLNPELCDAKPLLAQGLTTVVVNPDGGGPWPLSEQRQTYEQQGTGVNIALLVGQGTVRKEVMGMEDRAPTEQELQRMRALVREGMEAGAFGLSTGLYYAPGIYATTEEVIALAREVAPDGVYQSHIRDEGDYTIGLLAAVEEVITISEQAGIPGIVTHMKALGPNNWGKVVAACVRIERARARGVRVWTDQYPYEASGTSITGALIPRWAQAGTAAPDGTSPLQQRLKDPNERKRLREAMLENIERRGGPHTLVISRHRADPSLEGLSLDDLGERRGKEPVDVALDLLDVGGAKLVSFNMWERDIEYIMKKDYNMTASDGGLVPMGEGKPHPRYYGTFPRKIRRYVLDRGVVTVAHAIRSMTSLPATIFGFDDRGLLREGAWADVAVFDLEHIRDTATYQDPHQIAEGMAYVVVNGELAIRDGQFTGKKAGVVLTPHQ